MPRIHSLLLVQLICAVALCSSAASAAESNEADRAAELSQARAESAKMFKDQITPFLKNYCGRCHTGNSQRGGVTFESIFKNPDGAAFHLLWKRTAAQLATHDMPPDSQRK